MNWILFLQSKLSLVWFVAILIYGSVSAHVLIITHSYNRPDFIEIQYKTFKKFLIDEYEFVVFNDAREQAMEHAINDMCVRYGICCIRIPQDIHSRPYLNRLIGEDYQNSCIRCANVVQYSLDVLGFDHDGIVMIIDSDMFLIKQFSVTNFMQNYDLAGVKQIRKHVYYLWNGLVFFNMNTLPDKKAINFNCGCVDHVGVDVGGHTYYYVQQHPMVKLCCIDHTDLLCTECQCSIFACDHNELLVKQLNVSDAVIDSVDMGMHNIELLLNGTFFHYRGGTNWDGQSDKYHTRKTLILKNFIATILDASA